MYLHRLKLELVWIYYLDSENNGTDKTVFRVQADLK